MEPKLPSPESTPQYPQGTPEIPREAPRTPESPLGVSQERLEQRSEQSAAAVATPSLPVVPVVAPVPPVPVVDSTTPQQSSDDNPILASDDDLIEKEWVDKAKKIIAATRDDPHQREKEVGRLQADYLQKRYGKELGTPE